MISKRTKTQLLIFVLITLVGVSYVGARYARLDRLVVDDSYSVVAQFEQSGGIYDGAEVNFRGVKIGEVGDMTLTADGVDVTLDIDKEWDKIPADTVALVGNRSAVGEQYVELQPRVETGPYLADETVIPHIDPETRQVNTLTPLPTEKLLTDASRTLTDIDREDLQTTIHELGVAFQGTGQDLQKILDTGTSFVETADANFEVTTSLLRDSNTVLSTQIDSESSIRNFASDLSLFTGSLRGNKQDIIRLINNGSAAANEVRAFIEQNDVPITQLLSRVITTGKMVRQYLPGVEQVLYIYPYAVEAGFTVVGKDEEGYAAHFGLVLTPSTRCNAGYEGTDRRSPYDGSNRAMNEDARCTEPPSQATVRGAQNAPRAATGFDKPVATYDRTTDKLTWGTPTRQRSAAQEAPATLGDDSWKWLYLQPLTAGK